MNQRRGLYVAGFTEGTLETCPDGTVEVTLSPGAIKIGARCDLPKPGGTRTYRIESSVQEELINGAASPAGSGYEDGLKLGRALNMARQKDLS